MAKTTGRSLASRVGSVARRVVGREPGTGQPVTEKPVASRKAPATKKPVSVPVAKKTGAKKAGARKAAPAKKPPAARKTATKTAASSTTSPTTPAPTKKAPVSEAPAKTAPRARKGSPGSLVVLPGESSWTKEELDEVRAHLRGDVKRLSAELDIAEDELHQLMVDSGDGAGHDQADVGSSTFERDQEMVIANNARDMLTQSQHALERIADGSYGVCEIGEEPIGKMRLMAFPRATLCITCKQREERR
jgi:RNA polymerase-binding transcription factor DksA